MVLGEKTLLKLNGVSIGYAKEIYSGIEATANGGEMIALVGANGMGKSTLLRSISGLLKYRNGSIKLYGKAIEKYHPRQLARHISYVISQSPRIRNFSLFEMVSAGCYDRSDWLGNINEKDYLRVQKTIEMVGLKEFEKRDTTELSDGEFQRAAIARSLVQNSDLILLDEPTAFLDLANKILATKLLKEIAKQEKKTVIYSTHDLLQAIKLCDKIWILGYNGFYEGDPVSLKERGAFDLMFKEPLFSFNDYSAGLF